MIKKIDLGAVSAYALAVEKGYTGTEEEFVEILTNALNYATQAQESASAAAGSAEEAGRYKTQAGEILANVNLSGTQQIEAIEAAGTQQTNAAKEAIEAKGKETLDSIPDSYEALQGDVTQLRGDLIELENKFAVPTQEAVNNWLEEHPEATTTVQDHSLTIDKIVVGTLGYVTPEMFGAEGDGTHDDTVAVSNAIKSGMPVFCTKTYLVRTIDIEMNGALIYGGTFLLQINQPYIFKINANNVEFINTKFKGHQKYGEHGIKLASCTYIYFTNCKFSYFGTAGIGYYDGLKSHIYINRCRFSNILGNGIQIFSCHHVVVSGCCFVQIGTESDDVNQPGHDVYIRGDAENTEFCLHDIIVKDNTVFNTVTRDDYGYAFKVSADSNTNLSEDIYNIVVANNTVSNNKGLYIGLYVKGAVIKGNTQIDAGYTTESIYVGGSSCEIADNTLVGRVYVNSSRGLTENSEVKICNNTITANDYCIRENTSSSYKLITVENNILNCSGNYGIEAMGSSKYRIINNDIMAKLYCVYISETNPSAEVFKNIFSSYDESTPAIGIRFDLTKTSRKQACNIYKSVRTANWNTDDDILIDVKDVVGA